MDVRREDIPANLVELVNIIGVENMVHISKSYGGRVIYVPTYKSMIRNARDRQIVSEYDGYNANDLGNIYGLTPNHVYRIIRNHARRCIDE